MVIKCWRERDEEHEQHKQRRSFKCQKKKKIEKFSLKFNFKENMLKAGIPRFSIKTKEK